MRFMIAFICAAFLVLSTWAVKTEEYITFSSLFQCPEELTECPESKYYSIDGTCNNVKVSWAGKKNSPYNRLIPAKYDDGAGAPRTVSTVSGKPLPNPREASLMINYPIPWFTADLWFKPTHFMTIFGQHLAFDFTKAGPSQKDGQPVQCICDQPNPECINIPTPENDRLNQDQLCMITSRTQASYPNFKCLFPVREQMNIESHWLDLSQLYGSEKSLNDQLRDFSNGFLKMVSVPGMPGKYLSLAPQGTCTKDSATELCFLSGDPRVNENMVLSSIYTLMAREHNRVAAELKRINPYWNSERIYQEARRILIAVFQKIVYNDYLPIVIGERKVAEVGLSQLKSGYFNGYNPDVNPQVYNEFGVAAFRFGHSLVQSWGLKADRNLRITANISFNELLLQPHEAYVDEGLQGLLIGSLLDPSALEDAHLTDPIQNWLFFNPDPAAQTHRFSLGSLNTNRARDHGVESYNVYRKYCGLRSLQSFEDMKGEFAQQTIDDMRKVYDSVDDIDLWNGLISEKPVAGAIVGPTGVCIIAKQFLVSKLGDRLYYENGHNKATSFTEAQLFEIRSNALMSRIICDNIQISSIQPNAFLTDSVPGNGFVSCSTLPKMNLEAWKE